MGGDCIWDPNDSTCTPSLCGIADEPNCNAAKLCTFSDGHCYGPTGMRECISVCGCYAQTTASACAAHGGCTWEPGTGACSFSLCGGLDEQQCNDANRCTFTDGRCYPPDGCL